MKILATVIILVFAILVKIHAEHEIEQPKLERELVTLNGSVYYFSPKGVTFSASEGVTFCNDIGGSLVSLETPAKHNMIVDFIIQSGDLHDTQAFWTSGSRYQDNMYLWSNKGQKFTPEVKWEPGNPTIPSTECDTCIALGGNEYLLYDTYCKHTQIAIICEIY